MFMLVSKHLQLELQFLHFLICLVFTKRVSPAHKNWRRGDSWSIIPSPRLLRLCLGLLSAASLARWEIYRLGRGRSLHPGPCPDPSRGPNGSSLAAKTRPLHCLSFRPDRLLRVKSI